MSGTTQTLTFTLTEVEAMTRAAPCLWWQAFIELAVSSGLRTGEILRLHATDVDERTLSVRVTTDTLASSHDTEQVTLRRWMPQYRERIVPIESVVMRTLVQFQSKRSPDSHVFVPDWKVNQLWPRIVTGESLTTEHLCPGFSSWFRLVQRRARHSLANTHGVALTDIAWPHRSVTALRTTAILQLAERLAPTALAEHLGCPSVQSVLQYYDLATSRVAGGRS